MGLLGEPKALTLELAEDDRELLERVVTALERDRGRVCSVPWDLTWQLRRIANALSGVDDQPIATTNQPEPGPSRPGLLELLERLVLAAERS